MLALYIAFLSLGAGLFVVLERANEDNRRSKTLGSSELIEKMVDTLRDEGFPEEEIIRTFNYKHDEWKYTTEYVPVTWNLVFGEKFLFCMILITTIGYGNVAPGTNLGKYFCIVYCFVGIPLNLTLMRLLGLLFRSWLRGIMDRLKSVMGETWLPVVLGGFLYFAFFDLLLIAGPAAVFSAVEEWSYLQAWYYSFVSLSTIGLGDYVAGLAARRYGSEFYSMYIFLLFVWLVFGVAFMATCLNLISYGIGTLVLDKLDCRCVQRAEAKKKMYPVYQCLADLNWQMAKGQPKAFHNMNVFEDFMKTCAESPEKITDDCLLNLFEVAEELRLAIYQELGTDDGENETDKATHSNSHQSFKSDPEDPDSESPEEDASQLSDKPSQSQTQVDDKESSASHTVTSETSIKDTKSQSDVADAKSSETETAADEKELSDSYNVDDAKSSPSERDGALNSKVDDADGENNPASDANTQDESQNKEYNEDDSQQQGQQSGSDAKEEMPTSSSIASQNVSSESNEIEGGDKGASTSTSTMDPGSEAEVTDEEKEDDEDVDTVHKKCIRKLSNE